MYTYRDLIRRYSADVADGTADTDLTARQRRLVEVMLNLASNAGRAVVVYPPTDNTREDTVRHLSDILWEARVLVYAASPRASDDLETAMERTVTILRGM